MTRRRAGVLGVVLAALAGLALAGCSTANARSAPEARSAVSNPNTSLTARGGQFLTSCPFTHTRPDDPIVYPGQPGQSHQHDFYGNAGTDAFSTAATLLRAPSSCDDVGDHSGYWTPALFVNDRRVLPTRVDAYYRVGAGIDPASVQPFPTGLQELAGNQVSQVPQALDIVAWTCGLSPDLHHAPPSGCGPDDPVNERLTFPDCWNGREVTSPDHTSHLAYSGAGGCPTSHPVPLPQLTLVVHYPVYGTITSVRLASGPITTAHGDFFEAWVPARMRDQTSGCIDRNIVCGIVGGTFHTGSGSRDRDEYNHPQPVPGS